MLTVILGGGGTHNRGARCPVTHFVGHMLGGSGSMLPQKLLSPEISFPAAIHSQTASTNLNAGHTCIQNVYCSETV